MPNGVNRQSSDRRMPDRRSFEFSSCNEHERRAVSRRDVVDRRNDPYWRFSWLRTSVVQHLTG